MAKTSTDTVQATVEPKPARPASRGRSAADRGRMDELIVATAQALYEARGVNNVSLTDIALEGNFTRTGIYYYFDGKEDIVDRVIANFVHKSALACALAAESAIDDDESTLVTVAGIRSFLYQEDGSMTSAYTIMHEAGRTVWGLDQLVKELTSLLMRAGAFSRPRRRFRADEGQDIAFALAGLCATLVARPQTSDEDLATVFRASLGIR